MLFKFFRYIKHKKIVKKAAEKKGPRILYSTRRFLNALDVGIDWDADRAEYDVFVCRDTKRKKSKESKNLLLKPTPQLDAIMCKVKELSSPPIIFDGDRLGWLDEANYTLVIGDAYKVSFRWGIKAPEEWSSIIDIAQDLERIGDEIIPPDVSLITNRISAK